MSKAEEGLPQEPIKDLEENPHWGGGDEILADAVERLSHIRRTVVRFTIFLDKYLIWKKHNQGLNNRPDSRAIEYASAAYLRAFHQLASLQAMLTRVERTYGQFRDYPPGPEGPELARRADTPLTSDDEADPSAPGNLNWC